MEYKAHKESIKDASNRAHVQREQAEQSLNIRQAGAPAQGAGAGQHAKGEKSLKKNYFCNIIELVFDFVFIVLPRCISV